MTDPRDLVPGKRPPSPIELREVGPTAAALVGSIWARVGAPHGWTGASTWSDAQWEEELSRPGVRGWVAFVEREVAGYVELEIEPTGDVGIVFFGLVPEFVGRRFGGALLTHATRLAWSMVAPGGEPARRVWLQTTSRDHPNAVRNYEARGFRRFRTECAE